MKEQLENVNQDKRRADLRVERLTRTCDGLHRQITGLIFQKQESEYKISSLTQELNQLREENDVLRVSRGNAPFALH
jgi:chromosome segregation ATPase